MKKRFLYALLFGIPGFGVALCGALLLFGAAAGGLWLFVFGDSPWPAAVGTVLPVLFGLVFLGLWGGSIAWGFRVGRKLEADPALNLNHVLFAVGATAVVLLLMVLHQLSVGNLGPKSPSLACSDFCRAQGYAASGTSPRDAGAQTCSCFDQNGQVAVTTPLERLGAARP
jgi:hypothetical protein